MLEMQGMFFPPHPPKSCVVCKREKEWEMVLTGV